MKYLLFILSFIVFTEVSYSQEKADKIELTDLLTEIILTKKEGDNMKQVYLMPIEYWEAALADSDFANEAVIEQIRDTFEGYFLVGCLDINFTMFAGIKGNAADVSVIEQSGAEYKPLKEEELSEDLVGLTTMLKPMMANMMGQLGENLEFFVFKNENSKGNVIVDSYAKQKITITLNKTDFVFRTPFSALVVKKTCPKDGEALSGNWEFCPWHGKKLEY